MLHRLTHMGITRSQTNRKNLLATKKLSDNESEQGLPKVLSRAQMVEFVESDQLGRNNNFEKNNIKRRF